MKKKTLMVGLLAMLLVLALVGCGGGNQSSDKGEVRVYCYGDYMEPELVDAFEEETGIKVVLDTFDTAEEMYPVIAKGSVDYDVICVSDYIIQRLIEEDLLAEIDFDNVPNAKNIEDRFMEKAAASDPGNLHTVPHTYGTLGIMYNTEHIAPGELKSWNDLWNEKYAQQIVMPDSMRDNFAIALKALGYSINTTDEKELAEASAYMAKQKPLVYKYANDSARDLAIGGSADIAVVWNGEILYSQEENENLEYVLPEEGTEEFLDLWAIPAAAQNKENAEAWINFMLSEDSAIANYEYLTYSIPNTAVIDYIGDDEQVMGYLFPDDQVLAKCETLQNLGAEGDDLYGKYWKEFKAE